MGLEQLSSHRQSIAGLRVSLGLIVPPTKKGRLR